jgi:hypothetical protein
MKLQLFDHLGIRSFDSPLLKGKNLVSSNPVNDIDEKTTGKISSCKSV